MENSTKDESVVDKTTTDEPSTVETTDEDNSSEEEDRLSDDANAIIQKYEGSSDQKRKQLVDGLMKAKESNSLRKHQSEALNLLVDAYDIQTTDKKYSQVEERELEILKREKFAEGFATDMGIDHTPSEIVSNKKFLIDYRKNISDGMSIEKATKLSMFDNFDRVDEAKKQKAAQMTGTTKGKAKEGGMNPLMKAMLGA